MERPWNLNIKQGNTSGRTHYSCGIYQKFRAVFQNNKKKLIWKHHFLSLVLINHWSTACIFYRKLCHLSCLVNFINFFRKIFSQNTPRRLLLTDNKNLKKVAHTKIRISVLWCKNVLHDKLYQICCNRNPRAHYVALWD